MIILSPCEDCKNFIGMNKDGIDICKAYPEGIPRDIYIGKVKHDKPVNGYVYEFFLDN